MSTRAHITVLGTDGIFRTTYNHSDGYISGLYGTLRKNFDTQEKADWLVSHGDVSMVGEYGKIRKWEGEEAAGYESEEVDDKEATRFYCNRKGEDIATIKPKETLTMEGAVKWASEEYHYVWDGESWYCNLCFELSLAYEEIMIDIREKATAFSALIMESDMFPLLNSRAEKLRGDAGNKLQQQKERKQ